MPKSPAPSLDENRPTGGVTPLFATDRPIRRVRLWPWVGVALLVVLTAGLVAIYLGSQRAGTTLSLSSDGITVSQARKGDFTEFIPVFGRVLPTETVLVDAIQEGRVEEIFQRAGDRVAAGDAIFKISNPALELSISAQEASTIDALNRQLELQLTMTQTLATAERQVAEAEYRVGQLKRQHSVQLRLSQSGTGPESTERQLAEDLAYWEAERALRVQSLTRVRLQVDMINESIKSTSGQLAGIVESLRRQVDSLTARAPIDGYLTSLDLNLGQHLSPGLTIGQIDNDSAFKVEAMVDEFYLGRITTGQLIMGRGAEGGSLELRIDRVLPQITNGQFKIEAAFTSSAGHTLTRGQTINGRIQLSEAATDVIIIPMGSFWEQTAGQWAFVVDDRGIAQKRIIRVGRRTTETVEILEGLSEGEHVITSSYQGFSNFERLHINGDLSR